MNAKFHLKIVVADTLVQGCYSKVPENVNELDIVYKNYNLAFDSEAANTGLPFAETWLS